MCFSVTLGVGGPVRSVLAPQHHQAPAKALPWAPCERPHSRRYRFVVLFPPSSPLSPSLVPSLSCHMRPAVCPQAVSQWPWSSLAFMFSPNKQGGQSQAIIPLSFVSYSPMSSLLLLYCLARIMQGFKEAVRDQSTYSSAPEN